MQTTDKIKLWLDADEAGRKAIKNILRTPKQDGKNGLLYKSPREDNHTGRRNESE